MVFFVFDILCKLHKESYPFDSEHEKKNPLTRINMFLCVCVCGVRVSLWHIVAFVKGSAVEPHLFRPAVSFWFRGALN